MGKLICNQCGCAGNYCFLLWKAQWDCDTDTWVDLDTGDTQGTYEAPPFISDHKCIESFSVIKEIVISESGAVTVTELGSGESLDHSGTAFDGYIPVKMLYNDCDGGDSESIVICYIDPSEPTVPINPEPGAEEFVVWYLPSCDDSGVCDFYSISIQDTCIGTHPTGEGDECQGLVDSDNSDDTTYDEHGNPVNYVHRPHEFFGYPAKVLPEMWEECAPQDDLEKHCVCPCPNGYPGLFVTLSWDDPSASGITSLDNYHNDGDYEVDCDTLKGQCEEPGTGETVEYIEWLGKKWCNGQTIRVCPNKYVCTQSTSPATTGSPFSQLACKEAWYKTGVSYGHINFNAQFVSTVSTYLPMTVTAGYRTHKFSYNGRFISIIVNGGLTTSTSVQSSGLDSYSPTVLQINPGQSCPINTINSGFIKTTEGLLIEWEMADRDECDS